MYSKELRHTMIFFPLSSKEEYVFGINRCCSNLFFQPLLLKTKKVARIEKVYWFDTDSFVLLELERIAAWHIPTFPPSNDPLV